MTSKNAIASDLTAAEEEELIAYLIAEEQAGQSSNYAIRPRAGGGDAPLSFGQQRLWFLDQLEPGNPTYHLMLGQWFSGRLDTAALQGALSEIVRRHEILRTTFPLEAGEPVQRVHPPVDVPIVPVDATGLGGAEAFAARLKGLYREPFDLECGPLLRAWLCTTGADRHLLFVVFHHILGDHLSVVRLRHELETLYRAYAVGEPSPLAPLPIQYGDYAAWERAPDRTALYQRDLDYWRRQLAGLSTLELPSDHPRPAHPSFDAEHVTAVLPRPLLQQVDRLAQRCRGTRFMVLVAALAALLYRRSGQHDIAFGTPISNRNLPELEALIGYFTSTLVLRIDLSGNPTVSELMDRVRDVALGAYAHQQIPFEMLVTELKPERDLSRNPLFQVLMVEVGAGDRPRSDAAGTAAAAPVESPQGEALKGEPAVLSEWVKTSTDFDLEIYVSEQVDGLLAAFCYKTDLFAADRIRTMLAQWTRMVEAMTAAPQARVDELDMLSPEERRLAPGLWGPEPLPGPFQAVHRLVEQRAAVQPDAAAVSAGDGELTFAELDRRSNRLARALVARGAGAERLTGICLPRTTDLLVAVLGALKAGCAYVPLDPTFPPARLAFMAADAGLDLVVTSRATAGLVSGTVPRLDLDDEAGTLAGLPDGPLDTATSAAQLAYVIYTSGSTGQPKGVRIEHGALSNFVVGLKRQIEFGPEHHLLSVASLSFDASVLDLYVPLVSGARLILVDRDTARDGLALKALLAESGARVMHATPATWQLLIASGWQGDRGLRALSGGEALPSALADRLAALCGELWNLYGPTEATVYATAADRTRPDPRGFVDLGAPLSGTRIYVLDPALKPVPPGIVGELCIGGLGVARDYLNRPQLTAERFVADPFSDRPGARLYRTGDLARLHRDGGIEYLGRSDHQVKLRGYRIELGEIEAALTEIDGIGQAVVLCREDVAGDPRLVAYLVARAGAAADPDALRERLRERLPAYMVPSSFVTLDRMPLTSNGKIDRTALPAPPLTARLRDRHFRAPATPAEQMLAEVWRRLLGVEQVGLDDNFFDLGGHSLLAMKAIFEMKSRTGVAISPAEYMMQNLGQIAVRYDEALPRTASA
jgi:amino acid adenylation domain-containing protein